MKQSPTNLYEGLFLFNLQEIGGDLNVALDELRNILQRAEAEILTLHKWDERKLAYPMAGQKRGLYVISYFRARGSQIPNIERDVNFSENFLRAMMLKADHLGEAELSAIMRQAEDADTEAALRAEAGDEPTEAPTPEPATPPATEAEADLDTEETEAAPDVVEADSKGSA